MDIRYKVRGQEVTLPLCSAAAVASLFTLAPRKTPCCQETAWYTSTVQCIQYNTVQYLVHQGHTAGPPPPEQDGRDRDTWTKYLLDKEDFIYQRTTPGKQFLFVCLKGGGLFEFTELRHNITLTPTHHTRPRLSFQKQR